MHMLRPRCGLSMFHRTSEIVHWGVKLRVLSMPNWGVLCACLFFKTWGIKKYLVP